MPSLNKHIDLSFDFRDICLILQSLRVKLKRDEAVLRTLIAAKCFPDRIWVSSSVVEMPETLKGLSNKELSEQAPAWNTLVEEDKWWISKFEEAAKELGGIIP